MRIESIEIINFKNLRHMRLECVPQLVVIGGPNGSGKTALFDAIRVFKETIAGYSVRSPGSVNVNTLLQQVGPAVTTGEKEARIEMAIRISDHERQVLGLPPDHSGILKEQVVVRRQLQPKSRRDEYAAYDGSTPDSEPLRQLLGGLYQSGSDIGIIDHIGPDRRLGNEQVASINLSIEHLETEAHRLVLGSAEKFANLSQDIVMMDYLDLQDGKKGSEKPKHYIAGVKAIFAHFLPDVEFIGVDIPTDLSGPARILVESGGARHDITQLSSGQREILMTYAHLEKLRPTGSIILFDEPELHLHPALQRRVIAHLRRLLERGNNQIWVITHSEEIVGTTQFESLFAMTAKGSPAIVPVKERADRVDLLRQIGASVGIQLTSPRILFLEGDSDAELLPLFCETLPAGVSLVPTGGKRNLMQLGPAAMTLLEESIAEGQVLLVRDRDVEDDPATLDELQKKYSGRFFVWDRYHIENYLLDEEAILRVILDDPDVKFVTSLAEVKSRLRSLADERREQVIALHLEADLNRHLRKRIRLNASEGVRASLGKAINARRAELSSVLDPNEVACRLDKIELEVSDRWDSDWKKLSVGRDVLRAYHTESVARWHGYEVFRNSIARKIREMQRIPPIIETILTRVSEDLPAHLES